MRQPSIYEFAGGEQAFLALATAHHERCLQDPVLNHPFSHPGHPDHLQRLASYWAEVFGGPARYTRSCGGQSWMLGIHAGTGAEVELGALRQVLRPGGRRCGLPGDAEFRAALRAYMEWAVAQVMAISPQGSQVPSGLPVPRWSWDGLQSG